jgi:hypothetical protein
MIKKLLIGLSITLAVITGTIYTMLPVQATVNEDGAANRYTASGSTTVFTYTFRILSKNEVEVLVDSTVKTVDVDYTVSGVGVSTGGSITFLSAPANASIVTILRKQTAAQSNTYYLNEPFPSTRVEKDFDRLVMHVQQLKERLDRALTFAKSSTLTAQTVDTPTEGLFARAKAGGGIDWATPTNAGALSSPVGVSNGGTGATTAAGARANLLSYSENTVIDAKGDLLVGQFDNALARLPAPSTLGFVPQWSNSGTVGITWAPQQQLNPIINGFMDLWQRGTTFPAIAYGAYGPDRFKSLTAGAGLVTINRSTNVPTVAQSGVLFNYSLEVDVTTADTAITATDMYALSQSIEGYTWHQFAQRQQTVSFWVMSSKPGVYSVALQNGGTDRSYVSEYTINVADTWEYKSATFTASPSAGTWNYTSGTGASLYFMLAAGSNFTTTGLNTWNSNALLASTNQVNALDNTANFFRITGVKMELGSVATPIQFMPFEIELARAKRYYEKSYEYGTAPGTAALNAGDIQSIALNTTDFYSFGLTRFGVDKRTTPTITLYNSSTGTTGLFWDYSTSATVGNSLATTFGTKEFRVSCSNTSLVVNQIFGTHWTADAEL